MNKIKAYFSNLPFSFKHAVIGTSVITAIVVLQSFVFMGEWGSYLKNASYFILPILNYSIWLLLAPSVCFQLVNRFDSKNFEPAKKNMLLFGWSIAYSAGHEALAFVIYYPMFLWSTVDPSFTQLSPITLVSFIFGYSKTYFEFWILYFVLFSFYNRKQAKAYQLKNAQLEADLAKAQMNALKNQLQPHFLFNAFNTISSLMEENVGLAQRMITKLGSLLRKILKEADTQYITIENEIELAKLYLEVEQIRFKDRLVTKFSIDPKASELMVPTLLLQPIIENAIKHGFYNKTDECEIAIKISLDNDQQLIIEISDNGGSAPNKELFSFGIGLKNVRERLLRSYGEEFEFSVNPHHLERGFHVKINIQKGAIAQ